MDWLDSLLYTVITFLVVIIIGCVIALLWLNLGLWTILIVFGFIATLLAFRFGDRFASKR